MKARQRKKLRKDTIITMDLFTLPERMDISQWLHTLNCTGVIFWDSFNGGNKPTVYPKNRKRVFKIKKVSENWNVDKWTEEQKRRGIKFIDKTI